MATDRQTALASTIRASENEGTLSASEIEATVDWLQAQQKPSGEIPWTVGGKMDPWDHVHSAMGLMAFGRVDAALRAFAFMVETQEDDGGWAAERRGGKVTRITQESNHVAYIATGVWHAYNHTKDLSFVRSMWPTIERAIDLVLSMQLPSGAIAWAHKNGDVWKAPLITGCSSIHGSLVCAIRIAERLGMERPHWRKARERLARVLRNQQAVFTETDLPEKPGRHSMDWYYPVLGGAIRDEAGRKRLLDASLTGAFIEEGVGCRCVKDKPWYTIAETCELVLALDAAGLTERARQVLSWTRWLRTESGAYWTGATYPAHEIFPEGEQTTWTAAAVLIATDAVQRQSATSGFFRALGDDHEARARHEAPHRPSYEDVVPAAE